MDYKRFSISYSNISYLKKGFHSSKFGGSSRYKVIDDELLTVIKDKPQKPEITALSFSEIEERLKASLFKDDDFSTNPEKEKVTLKEIAEKEKKSYKLNKSKVKRKCFALSRLAKSKKFLAFYSISFPSGLSDDKCYKVFNIWLTRCRKNLNLNTYLWVAERQKNGTIHFHLLTNDFMPIGSANRFMAKALFTEKKKACEALQSVDVEKYNGVDVKKVQGSYKNLVSYLVKYISKNDIEFYRLPWHCSRDVSRLFTSTNFGESEENKYFSNLPESTEKYHYHEEEYFRSGGFKFSPDEKNFEDIDSVNEVIYQSNKNY